MFAHNKRLQYTVRVEQPNPGLANLMLEHLAARRASWPPPAAISRKPCRRTIRAARTCCSISRRKN